MHPSARAIRSDSRIIALLGPTNTGKTHYAIEQMASYPSGIIGFPLRLLARENYERLVVMKGVMSVALVTGEQKIVPDGARYFSCTVEAMPLDREFDFVAVDEIHLCADPDRGHIFTDRLLHARGTQTTMVMGSDVIRPLLHALVPHVEFMSRPRLSKLTYTGFKKMTRLPKRSAVVAFSIDEVYAIAELIRRTRGGTAVVLGALSPRTRNKQVEMYQNGEVDFLVATDAIGMGLNMDIHHIALAATRKFDGANVRNLDKIEIAQIAGRAGRYMRDGTFGTTGNVDGLDEEIVEAVENHEFESLKALCWRNTELDFASPRALSNSLDKHSGSALLARGRPADDVQALDALMRRDDVMARADGQMAVERLWDVCQIPDFRKTISERHQDLLSEIYVALMDRGVLAPEFVAGQLEQLDRTEGDVDALMARIAHIRTWTYITHKPEWLNDATHWAARARGIEDRLSDALHEGLTRRFVDRRASVLMRAMETGGELLAGVQGDGTVVVEGHGVGTLRGFKFVPDEGMADDTNRKAVMAAARRALKPEVGRRLRSMLNAVPKQFKLDEHGQVLYQTDATNPLPGEPIAKLRKGQALLQPDVDVLDSLMLEAQEKAFVETKLKEWLTAHIGTVLEALTPLVDEEGIEGPARGIAFQVHENLGIVPREQIQDLVDGLDETGRASLRSRKIRLGPVLVFVPALTKPASVRLRALLWALWQGRELPIAVPPDGSTSVVVDPAAIDPAFYRAIGYPVYGPRAIRVDMLDRLISAIYDSAKDGKFQAQHKMAEWLGCPVPVLYEVLEAMGHKKESEPAANIPSPPRAERVSLEEAVPQSGTGGEDQGEGDKERERSELKNENILSADAPSLSPSPNPLPEGERALEEATTPGPDAPASDINAPDAPSEPLPAKPAPAPRPELAIFRLRKGRAYAAARPERSGGRPQRKFSEKKVVAPQYLTEEEKAEIAERNKQRAEALENRRANFKPSSDKPVPAKPAWAKEKDRKAGRRDDRDDRPRRNDRDREDRGKGPDRVVASAKAEAGESPFAVLQKLKARE